VRSLEALTDDELAQRADDALRVLQAIRDEQEQRRWKNERPTIVYTGGDPNIRATFR
jgi:hypothetical protein